MQHVTCVLRTHGFVSTMEPCLLFCKGLALWPSKHPPTTTSPSQMHPSYLLFPFPHFPPIPLLLAPPQTGAIATTPPLCLPSMLLPPPPFPPFPPPCHRSFYGSMYMVPSPALDYLVTSKVLYGLSFLPPRLSTIPFAGPYFPCPPLPPPFASTFPLLHYLTLALTFLLPPPDSSRSSSASRHLVSGVSSHILTGSRSFPLLFPFPLPYSHTLLCMKTVILKLTCLASA